MSESTWETITAAIFLIVVGLVVTCVTAGVMSHDREEAVQLKICVDSGGEWAKQECRKARP